MTNNSNLHKKRKHGKKSFKTLLMLGVIICSLILSSATVFADDDDDDDDDNEPSTQITRVITPSSEARPPAIEPSSPAVEPSSPAVKPSSSSARKPSSEAEPEDEDEEEEESKSRKKSQEQQTPVLGKLEIRTQPKDLNLQYGQTSGNALVVEASAGVAPDAMSYQWYEEDKAIAGANKSTYIIPANRGVTSNPLHYHCVVKVGEQQVKSRTALVSIDRRVATLQVKGSLVYNGKNQEPTIVVGNLVSGDSCTVSVSVSGDHKDASRSYTATATSLSNPSYVLPSNPTVEFTISKKTINLAWSPNPCVFPYSGAPQAPTASTSGFAPEDSGRVQINISVPGEHKEAGNYTATATLSGAAAGNYDISDPTQAFTIEGKTPPVDKSTLNKLINTASQYAESIKSSYADIAATLRKAIDSAKAIYNKSDATTQEVTNAVTALTNAYNTATNDVDSAAANAVAAQISMLPRAADVRASDANRIYAARAAYDKLTASQKNRIDAKTYKRLTAAEDALAALDKHTLWIYPVGNTKEYGNDDPVLTYWIEEEDGTRTKSTSSSASKFKIKGMLIREDGEARGSYKVKYESDMDSYELAATLRSDKYKLKIVHDVCLTITPKTITSSMIWLSPQAFAYTGNVCKLNTVEVWQGSTRLRQDTDYIIENSSVLSATGSASQDTTYAVKITGRKNYTGTASGYWTIYKGGVTPPPQPSSTVAPASSSKPASTAQPSSTEEASSAIEPESSKEPASSESSEGTEGTGVGPEGGHLTSVNTGMPEDALRKLADSTHLKDEETALVAVVGESELQTLRGEGKQPEVQLTTKAMKVVDENEKKLAETTVNNSTSDSLTPAAYLDISLSVETTGTWQTVTQTKQPIEVTIDVPEEFQKVSNKFFVLRIHQGVGSLLFDTDEDPKTITIDSDQFSTYVLMYPGKGANTPAANGRTTIVIWILVGVVVVALILIVVIVCVRRSRRRRRYEYGK